MRGTGEKHLFACAPHRHGRQNLMAGHHIYQPDINQTAISIMDGMTVHVRMAGQSALFDYYVLARGQAKNQLHIHIIQRFVRPLISSRSERAAYPRA